MELLIYGLLGEGVDRRHLRAKVSGGAKMMSGLSDEGERNSRFVLEYLANEELKIPAGTSEGVVQGGWSSGLEPAERG